MKHCQTLIVGSDDDILMFVSPLVDSFQGELNCETQANQSISQINICTPINPAFTELAAVMNAHHAPYWPGLSSLHISACIACRCVKEKGGIGDE